MNTKTFNLPPLLMKIGQRDHLQCLKDKGKVYFGTYEMYRQQEAAELSRIKAKILSKQPITFRDYDSIRRDSREGLERTIDAKVNFKFMHSGNKIEIETPDAKLNVFQKDYTHLFCMFGFAPILPKAFSFDNRLSHFGDHVLIFDSKVFLTALARKLNTKFNFDYVSYYKDNIENVRLGPFAKRASYSYQYEYRVAANLNTNAIYIGDVLAKNKNTHLIKFEDLNKLELDIGL